MQINTTIKSFVPSSIADNFRNELAQAELSCAIDIEDAEWAHFDGGEIADIIVYIKDHATELAVTGLAAPFVYDIVKSAVIKMWRLLIKVKFRKEDKNEQDSKHISLRIEDTQNRVIQIEIKGDLPADKIEEIMASAFAYLQGSEKDTLFSKKEFVNSEKNQHSVQLYYNPETGFWEPLNFEKLRKEWAELMRQINNLDS